VSSYADDRSWSDRFLPEIRARLAQHVIRVAPEVDDRRKNSDLMVLGAGSARIACRVRRHQYLDRYGQEFTVRAARESGADVELTKLLSGFGDLVFYGFGDAEERRLSQWFIGDLNVFRRWYFESLLRDGNEPGQLSPSAGGTTFRAFRIDALPCNFVLDSSWARSARLAA